MTEPIEQLVRSDDPKGAYAGIVDIGKQGRADLAGLVELYLASPHGFLRTPRYAR